MEWKDIQIFLAKKNLFNVLKSIESEPCSLTKISKITGIRFEHVSKHVKELMNLGYVLNLTPDISKGKIFGISESGSSILKEIRERKLLDKE